MIHYLGREKMALWSTKAAISLKRVKIQKKLLWEAYRNSSLLFQNSNRYYLRNG